MNTEKEEEKIRELIQKLHGVWRGEREHPSRGQIVIYEPLQKCKYNNENDLVQLKILGATHNPMEDTYSDINVSMYINTELGRIDEVDRLLNRIWAVLRDPLERTIIFMFGDDALKIPLEEKINDMRRLFTELVNEDEVFREAIWDRVIRPAIEEYIMRFYKGYAEETLESIRGENVALLKVQHNFQGSDELGYKIGFAELIVREYYKNPTELYLTTSRDEVLEEMMRWGTEVFKERMHEYAEKLNKILYGSKRQYREINMKLNSDLLDRYTIRMNEAYYNMLPQVWKDNIEKGNLALVVLSRERMPAVSIDGDVALFSGRDLGAISPMVDYLMRTGLPVEWDMAYNYKAKGSEDDYVDYSEMKYNYNSYLVYPNGAHKFVFLITREQMEKIEKIAGVVVDEIKASEREEGGKAVVSEEEILNFGKAIGENEKVVGTIDFLLIDENGTHTEEHVPDLQRLKEYLDDPATREVVFNMVVHDRWKIMRTPMWFWRDDNGEWHAGIDDAYKEWKETGKLKESSHIEHQRQMRWDGLFEYTLRKWTRSQEEIKEPWLWERMARMVLQERGLQAEEERGDGNELE